jgi:hypothetical protein
MPGEINHETHEWHEKLNTEKAAEKTSGPVLPQDASCFRVGPLAQFTA